MAEALAGARISPSWARQVCEWTDLLPGDCRGGADAVLLAAAAGGAGLRDLAGLAEEIRRRTAPPGPTPAATMTGSTTGRCGWRPRSAAPGSSPVT